MGSQAVGASCLQALWRHENDWLPHFNLFEACLAQISGTGSTTVLTVTKGMHQQMGIGAPT